jgi:hypothetical protein
MSLLFPKYRPTQKEEQILNILQKLLEHPDTVKLMDPITVHYYLDNTALDYFVLVTHDFVKITNHKFYYTENVNTRFSMELEKIIKLAISKDRKRIEDEMFKNQSDLLTSIYQKLCLSSEKPENKL